VNENERGEEIQQTYTMFWGEESEGKEED